MLLNSAQYFSPNSIKEAVDLLSKLDSFRILAGGTVLINQLKSMKRNNLETPKNIVSLKKITDLKNITEDKTSVSIGSMATLSEIIDSDIITNNLCVLKHAASSIGTTPIRNMATIGGNLTCKYAWTEIPAVIIALEANLVFIDAAGTEQTISAEDFFQKSAKTDMILEKILINKNKNTSLAYTRTPKLSPVDIPLLSVCIKTEIKGSTFSNTVVAINNSVEFTRRDRSLEEFLNGNKATKKTSEEAMTKISDSFFDKNCDEYKEHILKISVKNTINEIINK